MTKKFDFRCPERVQNCQMLGYLALRGSNLRFMLYHPKC